MRGIAERRFSEIHIGCKTSVWSHGGHVRRPGRKQRIGYFCLARPHVDNASVWRDNQREATKLTIINGTASISLSPKGITALVIEGVKVSTPFQAKFTAARAPAKATTHQTIPTPFGEAHAMILSFGPELTWLYAYLTCDGKAARSAKLHVSLAGRTEVLTDDTYPFEFSLRLKPADTTAQLTFEAQPASGQSQRSDTVRVGRTEPK